MSPRKSSQRAKTTLVNWLDLPRDVWIRIFAKIGTIDLLYNAQRVCSSWRAIAKDPQLYRTVNMYKTWKSFDYLSMDPIEKMAELAIDRSRGQLLDFSMEFCTHGVLYKLLHKAPQLKCLRLASCTGFDEYFLVDVIEKLPLLEEVEFILPTFLKDVIEAVGRSCPRLKSFGWYGSGRKLSHDEDFNGDVLVITSCVTPALRRLHLLGNSMNNDGLAALLGHFTQLEYLDLRRCANLDLKGDLLKKCQGIKTLRLPNDSIEDYQFPVGERINWKPSAYTSLLYRSSGRV